MHHRQPTGSFIAENVAVIVVIFLFLTFPLIDLATCSYRYNMLCGAVKAAAHAGANSQTFTGTVPAGQASSGLHNWTGVKVSVPAVMQNYLSNARGISNVHVNYRVNSTNINTQVVTNNAWNQPLPTPPDTINNIYSVEVAVDADVSPIYPMPVPFLPNVPGLSGPSHLTSSAQELSEYANGLNQ